MNTPNCQCCGYDSLMRTPSVLSSLAESYSETMRTSVTNNATALLTIQWQTFNKLQFYTHHTTTPNDNAWTESSRVLLEQSLPVTKWPRNEEAVNPTTTVLVQPDIQTPSRPTTMQNDLHKFNIKCYMTKDVVPREQHDSLSHLISYSFLRYFIQHLLPQKSRFTSACGC